MYRLTLLLIVFTTVSLSSCGGDDPRAWADNITWQLRCGDTTGCTQDSQNRIVNGFSGEDGSTVSCSVSTHSASQSILAFNLAGTDNLDQSFSLRVQNALFLNEGGTLVGIGCEVTTVDGGNTYQGAYASGPTAPSTDFPCQLGNIVEGTDEETGSPSITTSLLCLNLPATGLGTGSDRDLTEAGSGGGADESAFAIKLLNCEQR